MKFSKKKLAIYLINLLVSITILVACNQANKDANASEVTNDNETHALFSEDDVKNAIPTTISETIDLPSIDLNNEEINIEGAPAPEEDSEIETLDVLNGVAGYLTYYRYNGERYHIWMANQATDVKKFVHSTTRAIQSVAVSGDGNWVAASMINPSSGKYDIYLFDVVGVNTFNLTNTASKDELDVSMTADATKIVFSRPTNAGLSKIRICDYNAVANSCTISTLGATDNQRQASITGNGNYIALIRDINPNVLWRVLLYDVNAGTYQIVTTRSEELSHPSASADGNIVMYLRDRTGAIGKYMIRMKNLTTNVIDNELTKPELGHPHMTSMANYAAYRDISSNNWSRPFTRNIATNARASAHSGDWNYFAPYWQQPQPYSVVVKVVAFDKPLESFFGNSVAISGDTMVVGDYRDNNHKGSAYIYERNTSGEWLPIKKIMASDEESGDNFGWSVTISGDTVVVGALLSSSAYIYERNNGGSNNWGETKKLIDSDGVINDGFGWSVSISENTVVVGNSRDDDNGIVSGSASIYERNQGGNNNWGEVKEILASDRETFDRFGQSVAISGNTVVIGAYGNDDNGIASGSVYIYERDNGGSNNWGEVKKITASDGEAFTRFGDSVAILGDALVVGASRDNDNGNNSGSAYIFERNHGGSNNWGEVKENNSF